MKWLWCSLLKSWCHSCSKFAIKRFRKNLSSSSSCVFPKLCTIPMLKYVSCNSMRILSIYNLFLCFKTLSCAFHLCSVEIHLFFFSILWTTIQILVFNPMFFHQISQMRYPFSFEVYMFNWYYKTWNVTGPCSHQQT